MLTIIYDGIEYKPYDHLYAVSRCGKVLRKNQPATPVIRKDGYFNVGRRRLLHRMIAFVWCAKPDGANHVHHINHDKADNRADNLQWLTPKVHFSEKHKSHSLGHKMSEAGKAKLRALRTGSKTSEATKQKQRDAALRLGYKPPPRPVGFKLSEESKKKIRDNSKRSRPCVIFGVTYQSIRDAALALNIKSGTLRKRILSANFSEYQWLV